MHTAGTIGILTPRYWKRAARLSCPFCLNSVSGGSGGRRDRVAFINCFAYPHRYFPVRECPYENALNQ